MDFTTLVGHAIHTRSFDSQVIIHRLKKNQGSSFRGSPTDLKLYLDSSLQIQLKVMVKLGRKVSKAGLHSY